MKKSLSALLLAIAFLSIQSAAALKPVAFFFDNMVLQRDMEAPVWGWAPVGTEVTVSINGQSAKATSEAVKDISGDGMWKAKLPAMKSGGPYTMDISAGAEKVSLKNVMVGDVWICAGQSNMEISLSGNAVNDDDKLNDAEYPNIRLFTVKRNPSDNPVLDFQTSTGPEPDCNRSNNQWHECSRTTVEKFALTGFQFGRELYKHNSIPLGLIDISEGGTSIKCWHDASVTEAQIKWVTGSNCDEKVYWSDLRRGHVYPLQGLGIKGLAWYQGESDACWMRPYYAEWFYNMINDWRKHWGWDFPFIYVQLQQLSACKRIVPVRDGQFQALRLPNTAMAVIADSCEGLHPSHSSPVRIIGERLALCARKVAYKENIVHMGPVITEMKFNASEARLSFINIGSGLKNKFSGDLSSAGDSSAIFKIAGADTQFVSANAKIVGNEVVVSAPSVPAPAYVTYGWEANPKLNLFNKENQPASPFWAPVETSPYFYAKGYGNGAVAQKQIVRQASPARIAVNRQGNGYRISGAKLAGIYDISGRLVAQLAADSHDANISWDCAHMQSGMYIVKARNGSICQTATVNFVK
jgi:sialate O-acetylesterase